MTPFEYQMRQVGRRRNRYQMAYARIAKMLEMDLRELRTGDDFRLKAEPGLILTVLCRSKSEEETTVNLDQFCGTKADCAFVRGMEIRLIHPEGRWSLGAAEALNYLCADPPLFQAVYWEHGFSRTLRKSLNRTLGTWLRNLEEQGYSLVSSLPGSRKR